MTPTSSLITGGVLLFGAAALANVFLPSLGSSNLAQTQPPAISAPVAAPAPSPEAAVVEVSPPSVAAATEIAHPIAPVVEASTPAKIIAPPAPRPNSTAVQKNSAFPLFSAWAAKAKELTAQKRPDAPAPEPLVSAPSPATPLSVAPAAPKAPAAEPVVAAAPIMSNAADTGGFVVSATLQDRVWIRIGDHRTVMAKLGETVPGLGKLTAVGPHSITIDGAKVLEVSR
jgi:hypothetical protein